MCESKFAHRFMDELKVEVALATIRISLCSWLQIVPGVLRAVEILQHGHTISCWTEQLLTNVKVYITKNIYYL